MKHIKYRMLLLSQPTEEAGKKGPEAESKQATASITKATPGTGLGPKVMENNIQQGIQRLPLSLKSASYRPCDPREVASLLGACFLSRKMGVLIPINPKRAL